MELEFDNRSNNQLSYNERLELIPALVDLAEIYFNEPHKIHFGAGICYSLYEVCNVEGSYHKMNRLMQEIGYADGYEYFEGAEPADFKTIDEWEPRAYMCLFLSEYLWNTLDETTVIEPELAVKQSTWDKIKDKVKSLFADHVFELQWNRENGIVTKTN